MARVKRNFLTESRFRKLIGSVEFDPEKMASFENIVLDKDELEEITAWSAGNDIQRIEDIIEDNVRAALLVFMAGLRLMTSENGIDVIDSSDETVMSFKWDDIITEYNDDVDRASFELMELPSLKAHRKIYFKLLKAIPLDEEGA